MTADLDRRIKAFGFENKCYRRRMFGIIYREHKTNEYMRQQVNILAGRQELLLLTVTRYNGSAMPVVMIRCLKWMVVVAKDDCVNYGRQHQGMDKPVDVVIAVHRR